MSQTRLIELLKAIEADGWQLTNPADRFLVQADDMIRWKLLHVERRISTELCFYLVGDLGQRSDDLRDVMYAIIPILNRQFPFCRIDSPEWRDTTDGIVRSLLSTATNPEE